MGEFLDVFFGTPQSLYASYAILAAIITICITILLTGTEIPIANRFLFIFLTILMLLPSIFLILFQITCIVTGGNKNTRWWCWLYAWIVAAFVIIYCVFVIIISFSSLFTYSNAIAKVDMHDASNKVSPEVSNAYAHKVMVENFIGEVSEGVPDSSSSSAQAIPPVAVPDKQPKPEDKKPDVPSVKPLSFDTPTNQDLSVNLNISSTPKQANNNSSGTTEQQSTSTFTGGLNMEDSFVDYGVEAFTNGASYAEF